MLRIAVGKENEEFFIINTAILKRLGWRFMGDCQSAPEILATY
jgi:hypothetical protein